MGREVTDADRRIGRKIKAVRRMQKVSQRDLADHLGISHQQVEKYETGTNRISAARFFQALAFMGADPGRVILELLKEKST